MPTPTARTPRTLLVIAAALLAPSCSRSSAPPPPSTPPSPASAPAVDAAPARPATDPALLLPFDPGAVDAGAPPLSPRAMRGPFTDLDAYCLAFVREAIEHPGPEGSAAPSCVQTESGLESGPSRATGPGALFEARVFTTNDGSGHGARCRVAACAASGWYVDPDGVPCAESGARTTGRVFALRDVVPGGAPEVEFRYAIGATDGGVASGGEGMVVCGVGASGRPSCARVPLPSAATPARGHGRAAHAPSAQAAPTAPTTVPIVFP